jgi:hypothetical protein
MNSMKRPAFELAFFISGVLYTSGALLHGRLKCTGQQKAAILIGNYGLVMLVTRCHPIRNVFFYLWVHSWVCFTAGVKGLEILFPSLFLLDPNFRNTDAEHRCYLLNI